MPNTSLIEELARKKNLEDSDIIIVEDNEDTKHSTIEYLKRCFNGDSYDPETLKFYSSEMINKIKNSLLKEISTKASQIDMESVKKYVNDIITTQSESEYKDLELIVARDGCDNLQERLERDKNAISSRALMKYKKSIVSDRVYLGGFHGYGDILVDTASAGSLYVRSVNLFNIEDMRGTNDFTTSYSQYGFTFTQKNIRDSYYLDLMIPTTNVTPGSYFFISNIYIDDVKNENDEIIHLKTPTKLKITLRYNDRSEEYFDYELNNINVNEMTFRFTAKKSLSYIIISFPKEDYIADTSLRFENVMITPKEILKEFIPYYLTTYPINGKEYVKNVRLDNCEVFFENFSADVLVDYYDDNYTTEYIINTIKDIQNRLNDSADYCGMIDNIGNYNYFSNEYLTNHTPNNTYFEETKYDKFNRNNKNSIKVSFIDSESNIFISSTLSDIPSSIKYITLQFYMDKYVSEYLEQNAMYVMLICDKLDIYPANNYYKGKIDKDCIVQGWNNIKLDFENFEVIGNPNLSEIDHMTLEISNNENVEGKSFYINSIVFNQTLKPTILLSCNEVSENTFNYLLPYMKSKDLECTLFIREVDDDASQNSLIMYSLDNTDIGQFACAIDKEVLLNDTNYKIQYTYLKNTLNTITNLISSDTISYSAPYGKVRPITSNILKNLGFKIVRTNDSGYCSYFSEDDLCVPSIDINNYSNIDSIKSKIDYIIKTGQVLGINTYDVTEYGDELNAKKNMFEEIIDYIKEKVDTDQLQCMSYKTFYNKCVK